MSQTTHETSPAVTTAPRADGLVPAERSSPEVSFVLPCLNEAATVSACVHAVLRVIAENDLDAEVIVADNGSTDGSAEGAREAGATVVHAAERGYGNAVRAGAAAARGRFIVVADADGSYDPSESIHLLRALREGADLAVGSRFSGGIQPGAMPWKNRYVGNPLLSTLGRVLFHVPVSDFHCGLRAFSAQKFRQLDLRSSGMELATEMIVKAALSGQRITEVPVTLRPDARGRPSHLRPWADGWRHLRFMLLLAPLWTLIVPGLVLIGAGSVFGAMLYFGPVRLGRVSLGVHSLIGASLAVVVGYQAVTVGLGARLHALRTHLGPPSPALSRLGHSLSLERGLLGALALGLLGTGVIVRLIILWAGSDFGPLDTEATVKDMILGVTCLALAGQTMFMSLFLSMLATPVRR